MIDVLGVPLQVGPRGPHGPHGPMGPVGGGGWGVMPWSVGGSGAGLIPAFLWLVVLLAVVARLVYLFRRLTLAVDSTSRDDAQVVLEARYARGEIDDEEFVRRRDRLAAEP